MNVPHLRHWFAGIALSLLLAWAAGAFFLDTVQPVTFDSTIGQYVSQPGTTSRMRSEGWASSHVGEDGIRGLPGGTLPPGPKVVFWGDSFVEGLQVNDPERMAQQFTQQATQTGLHLSGVGIGTGGDTLIDALVKAPAYTQVLAPVVLNIFVLGRISDVLPDAPRPCRAAFLSKPYLHIQAVDCPPSSVALRLAPSFRSLELAGGFEVYTRLKDLTLRFSPGPATNNARFLSPTAAPPPTAWDFLINQARQAAPPQIAFLYLPPLPHPVKGKVSRTDPDAATSTAFAAACGRNGVPFLNLGPAFLAHYQATGRFPRGFFNTPPGSGHLNADGHRMVAEAVVQYISEHPHALLAR